MISAIELLFSFFLYTGDILDLSRNSVSFKYVSTILSLGPINLTLPESNNTADSSGGAIAMYSDSNPEIYNAVVYDNYAGLFGGSMQISNSNPTINYSTIIANHGEYHGGVLYLTNESEVVVTNSILYDNIPEQFFINDPEDSLTVSFSNVQ